MKVIRFVVSLQTDVDGATSYASIGAVVGDIKKKGFIERLYR
jgi:hypothetical protein